MDEEKRQVVEEIVNTSATEEKKEKKKRKRGIIARIFDLILWIVLLGWMGVCLFDFYNVTNEQDPKFCLKQEILEYEDGNVDVCTGLGYKVHKYNRASFKAIEFVPFWVKVKENINN